MGKDEDRDSVARRWVWYSREESIKQRRISVLAIAEIPVALLLFFFVLGSWVQIVSAALAVPLLLMRSNSSVRAATDMWRNYADEAGNVPSLKKWVLLLFCTVTLSAGAALWLKYYEPLLIQQDGWEVFTSAFIIGLFFVFLGLVTAVAFVGALVREMVVASVGGSTLLAIVAIVPMLVTTAEVLMGVVSGTLAASLAAVASTAGARKGLGSEGIVEAMLTLSFNTGGRIGGSVGALAGTGICLLVAYPLGMFLATGAMLRILAHIFGAYIRSVFIRILSVLQNLHDGALSLRSNWHRTMFHEDSLHSPELIPGSRMLGLESVAWSKGNYHIAAATSVAMFTGYPLAILWRLSLKSTFWLFGPLIFVVHPGNLKEASARRQWFTREKTAWERLIFWVGLVVFALSLLTLFQVGQLVALRQESQAAGVPFDLLTWSLALDYESLLSQPWRWFSLANLLCALTVFFWRDALAKRVKNGEPISMQGWPVGALVRLARAQVLLFVGYWLLSLIYFIPFIIERGQAPNWLTAIWLF